MVIHDLHIVGAAVPPLEADAPLIIDPDAVLPVAVSRELFEPVRCWNPQIEERLAAVQHAEFPQRNPLDAAWAAPKNGPWQSPSLLPASLSDIPSRPQAAGTRLPVLPPAVRPTPAYAGFASVSS